MRIQMIVTERASPNGIAIEVYTKGEVYEVGKNITQVVADIFVKNRMAIVLDESTPEKPKAAKQADKKTKAHMKPEEDK